jgi:hypothetical protein
MDDEDKIESGRSQIPLIQDLVYNESLALRSPKKPRKPSIKNTHQLSPDYDPDTIDLFVDIDESQFDEALSSEELRKSAANLIDGLTPEFADDIGQPLREELSEQLSAILEDLNHQADKPDDS